jgi:hypothetical protein
MRKKQFLNFLKIVFLGRLGQVCEHMIPMEQFRCYVVFVWALNRAV